MIFDFMSRGKEAILEYSHYYIEVVEKPYYERKKGVYYYTPHIAFDIYLIHSLHVYFYVIPDTNYGKYFQDTITKVLSSLKLYLCEGVNDKYLPDYVYENISKLFKAKGCEIINGFITTYTTPNFHSQQKLY